MAQKKFVVRPGFNFTVKVKDARDNTIEKTYSEGDIVTLDPEVDAIPHQLELADEKDRAAAFRAEQEAKKAAPVAQVQAGGIDQAALANAIADGVARAIAALQAAAPASKPAA